MLFLQICYIYIMSFYYHLHQFYQSFSLKHSAGQGVAPIDMRKNTKSQSLVLHIQKKELS